MTLDTAEHIRAAPDGDDRVDSGPQEEVQEQANSASTETQNQQTESPNEQTGTDGVQKQSEDPDSYHAARKACIQEFVNIVKQCKRSNEKFTDPDFDIREDFRSDRHFIYGLPAPERKTGSEKGWGSRVGGGWGNEWIDSRSSLIVPRSVHRICEVFERPSFAKHARKSNFDDLQKEPSETAVSSCAPKLKQKAILWIATLSITWTVLLARGVRAELLALASLTLALAGMLRSQRPLRSSGPLFSSSEIKQSDVLGNCWLISAIGALDSKQELLRKICVAWDQDHAVYGFLFFRDGAWTHTVIDDYVFLRYGDYSKDVDSSTFSGSFEQRLKAYQAAHQTGSEALHFAKCRASSHTWLPLLEKAYAKLHGDYECLKGGFTFEGMQDLSGGVAGCTRIESIADKRGLWQKLQNREKNIIFGLSSASGQNLSNEELTLGHGYSIEKALEFYGVEGFRLKKIRLLKIRNPWGSKDGLWKGDWAAGCARWSILATWWLQPKLHEDGVFFMTYDDVLKTFSHIHHTKIMDEKVWHMQKRWAAFNASDMPRYGPVYFRLDLTKKSEVTFALSQLDHRYYQMLHGKHEYQLDLLLRREGEDSDKRIARTYSRIDFTRPQRDINLDLGLDPGAYEILVKLHVSEIPNGWFHWTTEDLKKEYSSRRKKIEQLAYNRDVAYGKLEQMGPAAKTSNLALLTKKTRELRYFGDQISPIDKKICGVGLRVFSKDPDMSLELRYNKEEDPAADAEEPGRGRSSRRSSVSKASWPDAWGGKSKSRSRNVESWKSCGGWGKGDAIKEDEWNDAKSDNNGDWRPNHQLDEGWGDLGR